MPDGISGELKAMGQLENALRDLQEDERARVLQWAASRFKFAPTPALNGRHAAADESAGARLDKQTGEYEDLATFYDAAAPSTDADRALVAAYWYQMHESVVDIEAQAINTSLKNLGHGIGNITRAFDSLKGSKPALLVQTRKDGSTKQARKKFKVTAEGRKAVERMLKGEV